VWAKYGGPCATWGEIGTKGKNLRWILKMHWFCCIHEFCASCFCIFMHNLPLIQKNKKWIVPQLSKFQKNQLGTNQILNLIPFKFHPNLFYFMNKNLLGVRLEIGGQGVWGETRINFIFIFIYLLLFLSFWKDLKCFQWHNHGHKLSTT
jgi:hypothetical protein